MMEDVITKISAENQIRDQSLFQKGLRYFYDPREYGLGYKFRKKIEDNLLYIQDRELQRFYEYYMKVEVRKLSIQYFTEENMLVGDNGELVMNMTKLNNE